MDTLSGKIALITGASKGIGAAIAKRFGASGATVIVNYSSSRDAAEQVVAEIIAAGGQASALKADFSVGADVDRCFDSIRREHGRLDTLVNNAAVFKFNSLEEFTADEFHRHFSLNVLGLLLASQGAARLMKNGGSILNITSIVASMAPARSTVYAASKGAVESATTALSKELGARGIRVNSLAPGGVLTEGTSLSAQTGIFKEFKDRTPSGRLGTVDEIASIALFLASGEASWINGQHIVAAGGMTM